MLKGAMIEDLDRYPFIECPDERPGKAFRLCNDARPACKAVMS
jgi:hypothetical protein